MEMIVMIPKELEYLEGLVKSAKKWKDEVWHMKLNAMN
jgi:hypothetical protein